MKPRGEDRDRSAVGVVGRVGDELIIERERCPFGEADRVIGFENALLPVAEAAIADQRAQTARGKEIAVIGGQAVNCAGNADLVVRSAPSGALEHSSKGGA